jgi:hypothetical protein
LTDIIYCTSQQSNDVLREISPNEFMERSGNDDGALGSQFASALSRARQTHLAHLFESFPIRALLLNARLAIPQLQFCLRHLLEGHSDSVQVLSPASFQEREVLAAMRLEVRSDGESADYFAHGPKPIDLVSFTRQGGQVEFVAFDPLGSGYAQVRAVWPGQVAEFFGRHAGFGSRELFTDASTATAEYGRELTLTGSAIEP